MKKTLTLLVLGTTACLSSLQAQDFRDNAFFKALVGNWKGEGQFTNDDQKSRPMTNRIEAAFDTTGTLFTIKGALVLGDENGDLSGNPLGYRWEIRRSRKTGGLFDGRFIPEDGDACSFEISIDEAKVTARFVQIQVAPDENRLELTKQVKGSEYLSRFTLCDSDGRTSNRGEMKFTREP